jgi:outer membrane lipopolysaccharide assembly protein LptE/RlpB
MTTMKKLLLLCLVLAALLPSGCGYRFSPGGETIDPGIRLVYIDSFDNKTTQPYVETYFRNAFADKFRRTSRFSLAASRGTADAYLRGSVNLITMSSLSYTKSDFATEDRISITASVVFQDRNKEIIWRNDSLSGYQDYIIDPNDAAATEQNRRAALQKLTSDLAERAFRNIMSGF